MSPCPPWPEKGEGKVLDARSLGSEMLETGQLCCEDFAHFLFLDAISFSTQFGWDTHSTVGSNGGSALRHSGIEPAGVSPQALSPGSLSTHLTASNF